MKYTTTNFCTENICC